MTRQTPESGNGSMIWICQFQLEKLLSVKQLTMTPHLRPRPPGELGLLPWLSSTVTTPAPSTSTQPAPVAPSSTVTTPAPSSSTQSATTASATTNTGPSTNADSPTAEVANLRREIERIQSDNAMRMEWIQSENSAKMEKIQSENTSKMNEIQRTMAQMTAFFAQMTARGSSETPSQASF